MSECNEQFSETVEHFNEKLRWPPQACTITRRSTAVGGERSEVLHVISHMTGPSRLQADGHCA